MNDTFGRPIDYLRLSVTDLCNYRCIYCMPEEGVCKRPHAEILSIEELAEIARAAVQCGIRKIRLTGGEPLVRRGILALCRTLRAIPELRELTMTTNGSLLPQMAGELKAAGLDRLNISLDTLDPARFAAVTRTGRLEDVLRGLDAAERAGFRGTKLNAVLLSAEPADIRPLAELTRTRGISVRFIELMPMRQSLTLPERCFVGAEYVLRALPELIPEGTDGVAALYRLPGAAGTVGLIRPMSCSFCSRCSRIRVTADGMLKPCLHSADEIPLRGLHGEALRRAIQSGILRKPAQHTLGRTHGSQARREMNEIGG